MLTKVTRRFASARSAARTLTKAGGKENGKERIRRSGTRQEEKAVEEACPFTEAARLRVKYNEEVVPQLKEKFGYTNVMQIPKLEKIVLNMGLGSDKDNPKGIESALEEMALIAGQKPIITKAKKSVANFKVREGQNVGAKVTLRGDRMYYFADKLMNIVLPACATSAASRIPALTAAATMRWALKSSLSSRNQL